MAEKKDSIVVIWTSGERDVALEVAFPYTLNSKLRNWWEEVILVVWGPSTKLMCHDLEIQAYLEKIKKAGIKVECCKACADRYGLSEKLESLGIHVKYMGEPTTKYLKEGRHILTY